MKKTNKFLVAFASLGMVIAGGAAIGMMAKSGIRTKADTATKYENATNGVCDFTSAITATEATHWTVSNFTDKTGFYQSSGTKGAAEYIKFYNSTNPFAAHTPTSIVVTMSVAGGSAKSGLSWSMSLLDSTGAVISATKQSAATYSVTTTAADKTWTFSTSLASAYGVQFDTTKVSGWNLRVYTMTVQLGYEATVDPVASIALDKTTATCAAGEPVNLSATVLPTTALTTVSWSVSDSALATVSNGVVSTLKGGTLTVTATTNGKDSNGNSLIATCVITISETVTTLADVATIGAALATGAYTNIIYTVTNKISAYTSDRQFTISDGTNTMVVYGSYNQFLDAGYIVGGTITARARIKNYSGTVEMCPVNDTYLEVSNYSDGALTVAAWISSTDRDAETCANKYSAAKAMVLALDSIALTKFENSTITAIVDARTRYVNWCNANSDTNYYATGSGAVILNETTSNETSSMIVVIVSMAIVLAGGAYLYIRRRKHA
jgi:hypothetical protein